MKSATSLLRSLRQGRLATYLVALGLLLRDARTPRVAKLVALLVLAYALSPIDLVPDFIPVLGMLDDLVLLPLGIALVVRLVPRPLWQDCLARAEQGAGRLPRVLWGAAIVIAVWLAIAGLFGWWLWTVVRAGA